MESFLENLKHQVQCSLCNETLFEPKLLQCFHTFCKSCIKSHAHLTEEVNIFKCPQCTSQTLLQDLNDVEDLKISPVHSRILQVLSLVENQKICSVSASHSQALSHCLDCNQSLCEECLVCHLRFTKNHQVVSLSDLKKEDIEKMLKRENPCKTHDNQVVNFHCQHCNILICLICLKDHQNHKTISLQEFIAIEKDLLSKNLEEIDKMSTDEKEKKQQEEIALLIKSHGDKAQEQVKELTKKLVKALTDNEQHLLNQIQKSKTKADRNLRIIRHTIEAREFIRNLIEKGTASDMAADNKQIHSSKQFTYDPFPEYTNGYIFEELCDQMSITHDGIIKLIKNNKEDSSDVDFSEAKLVKTENRGVRPSKASKDLTEEEKKTQGVLSHVGSRCQGHFPPQPKAKGEGPGNEVVGVDYNQVPVGSPQMQYRPTLSYNNMNPQMNFLAYSPTMAQALPFVPQGQPPHVMYIPRPQMQQGMRGQQYQQIRQEQPPPPRKKNIINIKDPETNKNVTEEVLSSLAGMPSSSTTEGNASSHSSSSNTPPINSTADQENTRAKFAQRIAAKINEERDSPRPYVVPQTDETWTTLPGRATNVNVDSKKPQAPKKHQPPKKPQGPKKVG